MTDYVYGNRYTYTNPNGQSRLVNFVHGTKEMCATSSPPPQKPLKLKQVPKANIEDQNDKVQEKCCNWKVIAAIVGGLLLLGVILAIIFAQTGNGGTMIAENQESGTVTVETKVIIKDDQDNIQEDGKQTTLPYNSDSGSIIVQKRTQQKQNQGINSLKSDNSGTVFIEEEAIRKDSDKTSQNQMNSLPQYGQGTITVEKETFEKNSSPANDESTIFITRQDIQKDKEDIMEKYPQTSPLQDEGTIITEKQTIDNSKNTISEPLGDQSGTVLVQRVTKNLQTDVESQEDEEEIEKLESRPVTEEDIPISEIVYVDPIPVVEK